MNVKERKLVCDLASALTTLQDVKGCNLSRQVIISATYALWKFYKGDFVAFKNILNELNDLKSEVL